MGACALKARRVQLGLRVGTWRIYPAWRLRFLALLLQCDSTHRLGYGGGNLVVDGFQMGYQVCPQSPVRLLWSRHLPQLWFSCPAKAFSGMPVKPKPPLPRLLLPGTPHVFLLSLLFFINANLPEVEREGVKNLADSWAYSLALWLISPWDEVAV